MTPAGGAVPESPPRPPAAGSIRPRLVPLIVVVIVVVAPLAAGLALRAATIAAGANDPRVRVQVSATRWDWVLLLGAGVTASLAVAAVVAVLALRRGRRTAMACAAAARARADDAAALQRRLLLSRLDHELKNPLTAIRVALANVSDTGGDAVAGEALTSIGAQVGRLTRLTSDLRRIADIGTAPLEREPVDVGELIGEAVSLVLEQPEAVGRRIRVDVPSAPRPLPPVPGDRDLLGLALVNLLDNAIKYTEPGDAIEVRARDGGRTVTVEVADTGPGIPPSDVAAVWEELYRSRATRARPGSGLGLPLVRAVAERHGGWARVSSDVGQGSSFVLELPLDPSAGT